MYIVIAVGIFHRVCHDYCIVGCSEDIKEVLDEQFTEGDPWTFIDKLPELPGLYLLTGFVSTEPDDDDYGFVRDLAMLFRVEKVEIIFPKDPLPEKDQIKRSWRKR